MPSAAVLYIPMDRRHQLAADLPLPDPTAGAALFADISGFTPLTEAMVLDLGPRRGAEELTRQINQVFDALITEVHRYRGSVITFSGDAITCWFDRDHGLRATACALAMQQAMKPFASITTVGGRVVSLAMKAAVATGLVRRFVVGDPEIQYHDVLAGDTLDRMASAEQLARRGEVVLDPKTLAFLGPMVHVQAWRGDPAFPRFGVVSGLATPVPPSPWPDAPSLTEAQVRPWLLPPVYQQVAGGQELFLAEIRPVTSLFLRFGGIQYDEDPDAGKKLDAYIRWAQQLINRYEGFLLQITMGDKGSYLCCVFGTPLAHDDDSLRAAAAALELQSPPPDLSFIGPIQIGIARGQMRTGSYGGINRHTYGVIGDDVNLSARLMTRAAPGQILVSPRIAEETRHSYRFQSIGLVTLKGKREPIEIFLLLGKQEQVQQYILPHTLAPTIGRETELAQIEQWLGQVLAGEGTIVRLEGPAGIGKSHLAAEVGKRASHQGLRLLQGICQSVNQGIAYTPWRQILNTLFGIRDGSQDSIQDRIHQVETLLKQINPDWVIRLPLLGEVLGFPIPDNPTTAAFDARFRQEALTALVVSLLHHWARQTPTILIIEDAHWMDEASNGLILALGRSITRTPLLLMLVQRPPLDHDHPLLPELDTLPYCHTLLPGELSPEATGMLIARHLQGPPAPLLQSLIYEKTQGTPFFVEETIFTLKEAGNLVNRMDGFWSLSDPIITRLHIAGCLVRDGEGEWVLAPDAPIAMVDLGIPDSIQGVVLARIDRLPETHKLTLKVASVIGRVFMLQVLLLAHPSQHSLEQLLDEVRFLEERDFTLIETPFPQAIYIFRHNVTQEVTYSTLLETQRQHLHQLVGETLELLFPEQIEQLAYHFQRSGIQHKALDYLEKAARKMQHDYANETALYYYEQALAIQERWEWRRDMVHLCHILGRRDEEQTQLTLLEAMPDASPIAVAYLWGRYFEALGDYPQAIASMRQALDYCRQYGTPSAPADNPYLVEEMRCLNHLGMIARRQGDYGQAWKWYSEALLLVDPDHPLSEEMALAYAQAFKELGIVHYHQGHRREAHHCYEQALRFNRERGYLQGEADVLNSLGVLADTQGQLSEAVDYYRRALTIRQKIGDRTGEGGSLMNLAIVSRTMGNYSQALEYLLAALEIQQSTANRWEEVNVCNELGILYRILGDDDLARISLQQGLALTEAIEDDAGKAYILSNLGAVARDCGDLAAAEVFLHDALSLVRHQGDRYMVADILSYLATVSMLAGLPEQAITQATESLEIQRQLGINTAIPTNLATLASAYLQTGPHEQARNYAYQALALLEEHQGEGCETPHHDAFVCYQVLTALGEGERAGQALSFAHQLLQNRANTITDPVLRRSFLHQVEVNRHIIEAMQQSA